MSSTKSATVHIDPARIIDEVDPRIYSGFTEHMGRCIYGGLYDPDNQHGLAEKDTGFRIDVLEVLKELDIPLVRYPGGPELAWLSEESNQFGTDEFIQWCGALGTEPYICLNMGTGTLEDALAWLEYCNSSANTHYANLRRRNGHEEPYGVKYWSLGNEVWGPWQVGQMESHDYAKKAYQWAKALRLLDPTIKIVSCGETGHADWDRVILKKLAPVVDFHSVHAYTVSEGKHAVNVMGPAAAEKALEITRSLIDLAKIENGLRKALTVCFDEWNVWDPVRAPGEKGAEEHYDLSDALAVAAWLNVFVRKADIVKIACIAQSVNVISPIITSPSGLFRQTTFYPLKLFSTLMRGSSLDVYVDSPSYNGATVPPFISDLAAHTPASGQLTKYVDISAVLVPGEKEIRVAAVNRSDVDDFEVHFAFGPLSEVHDTIKVYEVWSENLGDGNDFEEKGGEKVGVVEKTSKLDEEGKYLFKKHSFQGLSQAVEVYLIPAPATPASLSPSSASFALSRHLGLEFFESAPDGGVHGALLHEQSFVGQGSKSALLLSIDEEDARDIIPSSMKVTFTLSDTPSVPSLSSLVSTYLHRAQHAYTTIYSELSTPSQGVPSFLDIFSVSSSETETFIAETSALSEFLDVDELSTDKFAAFELKGLRKIAAAYGRTSEQYQTAARTTRAVLESALAKRNLNVALVTFSGSSLSEKRAQPSQQPLPPQSPVPQQPIAGVSTCFTSADVCTNSTNSCSGRGECMQASKAGKTCFICSCSQTSSKGKTQDWVGDACERKDISGPFVLLAGSTIGLILLIGGSIALLAAIGDEKLPSTLTSSATGPKRE
ncbi:hypothetical protein HWV62_31493 [Athelia sp. TMB]|nr:hypothetical protein HWV62_31493 [Athelia sp. TMB]